MTTPTIDTTHDAATTITTEEQLREVIGFPRGRAVSKERTRLLPIDRQWLAASPYCVLATTDDQGFCDASPKGDPPGFVRVLDDVTVAIPERPGNRRADGYLNILRNPRVGILSLIPGRGETLRINGRATLVRDAPYFDDMVVRGHRPILAIEVAIEQVFFHCAKASLRSELWRPDTWHPEALPPHAVIVKSVQETEETLEELMEYYGPSYEDSIYVTK
jgi:PPOX class probable FMN-dependent enzyme